MAVILEDLGDGALVDALQTELPLAQLQETSTWKKGRDRKTEGRHFILDYRLNNLVFLSTTLFKESMPNMV